ncbi:F-box only protein 3 isoform X7 [Phyllopteryx taeniolatus]|uniref:F-box only protein 3 isoform X7 n=1 Tax=Phyllopteryx taeniolatus TaxID=161469 RepID=UPI002AD53FAF|nr:F-box only protein 3 isoform X7 [Phyllopteryx taeniolatus]
MPPEVHDHLHSVERVQLQVVSAAPQLQPLHFLSICRLVTVFDEADDSGVIKLQEFDSRADGEHVAVQPLSLRGSARCGDSGGGLPAQEGDEMLPPAHLLLPHRPQPVYGPGAHRRAPHVRELLPLPRSDSPGSCSRRHVHHRWLLCYAYGCVDMLFWKMETNVYVFRFVLFGVVHHLRQQRGYGRVPHHPRPDLQVRARQKLRDDDGGYHRIRFNLLPARAFLRSPAALFLYLPHQVVFVCFCLLPVASGEVSSEMSFSGSRWRAARTPRGPASSTAATGKSPPLTAMWRRCKDPAWRVPGHDARKSPRVCQLHNLLHAIRVHGGTLHLPQTRQQGSVQCGDPPLPDGVPAIQRAHVADRVERLHVKL